MPPFELMAIPLPIPIEIGPNQRMKRLDSPYGWCGQCQYVGVEVQLGGTCPKCGHSFNQSRRPWPLPEFNEIWDDVVFAYRHKRAELAAICAAMYFEAGIFDLMYWGFRSLHPELSIHGVEPAEEKRKEKSICERMSTIRGNREIDKACRELFDADQKEMLEKVLGSEYDGFWGNYQRLRQWRNAFAHRRRRVYYRTVNDQNQEQECQIAEQQLSASIHFVPTCWVVHSKSWNEYIHKRLLAMKRT